MVVIKTARGLEAVPELRLPGKEEEEKAKAEKKSGRSKGGRKAAYQEVTCRGKRSEGAHHRPLSALSRCERR